MGQVPSESGRRGKHKVNLFFHRIVKKEPFNCVVTRLNAGLFHGDFCFLVTLQHIQFIQYEIWRQYGFLNTTQFIACLEKLKQCELRAGTYLLCLQDKVRSDGYLSKQLNPCFGLNKSKGPRCKMYPPMWKSQLEKLIGIYNAINRPSPHTHQFFHWQNIRTDDWDHKLFYCVFNRNLRQFWGAVQDKAKTTTRSPT